jgi:flagellar assembly protein FliH
VFTAQEMEAARTTAYETGYNAGQKAIMENQQQYLNVLLSQLDQQLSHLIANSRQQWQRQLTYMQEMAMAIVRKTMPAYAETHGLEEIEALVTQVMAEMAHEPRLVIRIGEAQFDAVSAKINSIAEQKAYMGKIAVLCENDLGPADCRVEWADGGIERDMKTIWEYIDRLMENAKAAITSPQPPE